MTYCGTITQRPDRPERLCALRPSLGVQSTFGIGETVEQIAAELRTAGLTVEGLEVWKA